MAAYLLVLGERDALAWVLAKQRMAFPEHRATEVSRLQQGDALFLYTTRGCFHNPTRDPGRVIGLAEARSAPVRLSDPISVAGREYALACEISVGVLASFPQGVELLPLTARMESFPTAAGVASRLRRPLVGLTANDARLLMGDLRRFAGPTDKAIDSYLAAATLRGVEQLAGRVGR